MSDHVYTVTADKMPQTPGNVNVWKRQVTAATAREAIDKAATHLRPVKSGDYVLTAIKQAGAGEYASMIVSL